MMSHDEPLEERYHNPHNHKDGTYIHPLEESYWSACEWHSRPTEQGRLMLQFIRRQLIKGDE